LSTVVTLPSKVIFSQVDKFQLLRSDLTLRSKYTGKRQVLTFPFALWVFEATVLTLDGTDAAEWRSFLAELEGSANTFRLPVPGVAGPLSGYAGPNGTVTGTALARAKSLTSGGWTASKSILTRGDFFTINDELKLCTGAVSSSGTGTATIPFQPPLRQNATAGMTVNASAPTMMLSLQKGDGAQWGLEHPVNHDIKLLSIEAF
jgi:hypothetical protein